MFFSLAPAIISIFCILVQVTAKVSLNGKIKVEVLAISEMELSKEFTTKEEIKIFFCDLFREVQMIFDAVPYLNITIELSGVSVNWRAEKQDFVERRKWTYENKKYLNPDAISSLREYAINERNFSVYDVAILFTRIPFAYPDRRKGEPQVLSYTNRSVIPQLLTMVGCEYRPNMAMMNPSPKSVAVQLAYLLGAIDKETLLHNPSWFEDCKEDSSNYNINSDPNGPFSKCSIMGIKKFLRQVKQKPL